MRSLYLWFLIAVKTVVESNRFVKSGDRKILKRWAAYILKISKVEVECVGSFPDLPFMILANHESYFDIFSLFYCCDFSLFWFAKKELFNIPFFGRALTKSNAIAVDRNNPKGASFAILRALKSTKSDGAMVIFPQGTRKNPTAFKQGGLLIAKKKNMPIVPIKISNSKNILASNSWTINPGKITVNIFDKIDTEQYSIEELEKVIREKVYD